MIKLVVFCLVLGVLARARVRQANNTARRISQR